MESCDETFCPVGADACASAGGGRGRGGRFPAAVRYRGWHLDQSPDRAVDCGQAYPSPLVGLYRDSDGNRRFAVVRGAQEGDFTLTARFKDGILGMSDPPHIRAGVLSTNIIPLHVYIARGDDTPAPLVDGNVVEEWMSEVNNIYRQVALKFVIIHTEYFTSIQSDNWRDITTQVVLTNLYSYTNVSSGLELYCVRSLPNNAMGKATFITKENQNNEDWYGIAINVSTNNLHPERTLAHEIGHTCGLDDIYLGIDWRAKSRSIKSSLAPYNWTGGNDTVNYLHSGQTYSNIVVRSLMHGFSTPANWDIPFVGMQGASGPSNSLFQLQPIGLDRMNRAPSH